MSNPSKSAYIPYVLKTNGSVTLYLKSGCLTVDTDHPNYAQIIDHLKQGTASFELMDTLINGAKKKVEEYVTNSQIKIEAGLITFCGIPLHNTLTARIRAMMVDGFKMDHMVRFLENLVKNPSNRALNELYTFLENKGLPITDDGCFIAYKAVKNNYYDIYTGKTFLNTVGATIEMPRVLVDENYEQDCSTGLHCGALDYVTYYGHFAKGAVLPEGGNRLLLVKVNPADVVSVPKYESHPKIRVCKYEVVNEITDIVTELSKSVVSKTGNEIKPDAQKEAPKAPTASTETSSTTPTSKFKNSIVTPSSWNGIVDADSPIDADDYADGWAAGTDDRENERNYGVHRDYSRSNGYRIGYNDAFNNRDYAIAEDDSGCCGDCSNCACGGDDGSEDEYRAGFALGREDYEDGEEYQFSLSVDDSDLFKQGYIDGWEAAASY